jgi:hypothetical protein
MRSTASQSRHDLSTRTASVTLPISRSTALKWSGGAALIALSFWTTLQVIEYFQSSWQPIRSDIILTFGDASASSIYLTDSTKFQFGGYGYALIQGTNGLQCLKYRCKFSLAVTFAPVMADPQLIIGQSFQGETGWHLFLTGGGRRLLLQTDGGANELAAPFSMKPGQSYKIGIARDDQGTRLSVDDLVVAKSSAIPFTDLARNLTLGGREGPVAHQLMGTITHVQIAREKLPP